MPRPKFDSKDKEFLKEKVLIDIQTAENYFDQYIKPKLIERYQIYAADKSYYAQLFKKLSQRSSVVSTDVADTVEWALPSLMRIFFGGEEVVSVVGREPEDEKQAELMQKLINFQIQTLNPGFLIFYRWFKDALISGLGIIKCWWEREIEKIPVSILLSKEEADLLDSNAMIEVVKKEEAENGVYVYVDYYVKKLLKNQPVFANVPPNEFLYHPDAQSIAEASFVAHRKIVTADYLRRKAIDKVYDKEAVERAIQKGEDTKLPDMLDYAVKPNQSWFTKQTLDEAQKQFVLYECYTKYDINNDGLLEPVIITLCNDEILRVEENTYGRPPFFVLSPILEPYEIWGKSFADVLGDIQAIKTALIRQILVNIALNNDPKLQVLETAVNLQDLVLDKEFIRVRDANAIKPLAVQPLAPWTYNFLEYIEGLKENRTGVTRYNQGLDSRSLNKRIDINTPVPMADGTWKLLKDIQDGDIILGGDGKPTRVIKAHEIALCEDSYKLTFSNGAIIYADGEHLWGCYFHNRYKVATTKEIYEALKKGIPVYIPKPERIYSGDHKELPIDPYVLGVWLGDGHKYSARITTADEEIIQRIREYCEKQGWEIREDKHQNSGKAKTYIITSVKERVKDENGRFIQEDSFIRRLKNLGVFKGSGGEPHIPAVYFTASYEQRLELLRGLMDTDGCFGSNGIAIFSTSNYRLAEDVARLVRSLGGNPKLVKTKKTGKEIVCGIECNVKEHYQVRFNLVDCPFYITKKASKWKPPVKQKTYRIVIVEPAEPRYMRCLTVDNPDGLWLVGEHYITTHNTATGIQLIMSASQQRLELIARIFAETGIKDFFRFLIELNQRFITQDVVVRLTNETLTITPDDLQGNFDLEVNAGIGVGVKEQTLNNLQMIMQFYPQLLQLGIATPMNVYNAFKKFLEVLGIKNTDDFITKPQGDMHGQGVFTTAEGKASQGLEEIIAGKGASSAVSGIPAEGKGTDFSSLADILSYEVGGA